MKIAFITPEFVTEPFYSGGLANYLGRITQSLASHGHQVHVFTRSTQAEQFEWRGVLVHRVVQIWDRRMILDRIDPLVPRVLYNPYQDLKAAWCLWKAWKAVHRDQGFDIVQVANVMSVGLFFRSETRIPIITRLSSYRFLWDTSAGIEVNLGVRCRWQMEKIAIQGTPFLYAPTRYVADKVEEETKRSVGVIESPFFIEEESLDTSCYEQSGLKTPYLLFFGRMTQMKGAHLLAQALPELFEKFSELNAVFIGGSGPAPDQRPMPDYIRELLAPWADRFIILGSLRHAHLYPFIHHSRIVVLPSIMDNLPNTCLEALGLGKIVIATTGSCFEQIIKTGYSGILVKPGDVQALCKGIENAWNMPTDQRKAMETAAQESIQRLHPDVAVPKLVAYYQSTIDQLSKKSKSDCYLVGRSTHE